MADALRRNDSAEFTRAATTDPHYKPLVYSALDLAIAGVTSLDEVFRVTEQLDESIYLDAPEIDSADSKLSNLSGLELE
jgi:MSHA biogenesis protein MshE